MKLAVAFTCEHGGNDVPAPYRDCLRGAEEALASHRGFDRGALAAARDLAHALDAPLFAVLTTRLLVDANRSLHHRGLFSEWSRRLSAAEREALVERCWRPHRRAIEGFVRAAVRDGADVLHLSIHSFTPVLDGRPRDVDVGFLYDPKRRAERAFVEVWRHALAERRGDLRLRRNAPYRGDADGLTTYLRTRFEPRRYLGLELELSQALPDGPEPAWGAFRADLCETLRAAVAGWTDGAAP